MPSRVLAALFLTSAFTITASADDSLDQCYRDLSCDAVVMNISAHPDDEDGATLTYYRKKLGARTYSVLFTRGEGGQNEIGPELYEELAVIRTDETLEAGEILGAKVDFLNFSDFGFSRSATEAFKKWGGRNEVLRRLVYFIRKYKPDILFTNHSTGGGHGHHQAVAVTAIAAFDAAADPAEFPEQLMLEGITLWQPSKLYLRIFGSTGGKPDVSHPVNEVHPPSGVSYLEIASTALKKHKSQGMESTSLTRFSGGLSLYRLARTSSAYAADTASFLGGLTFLPEQSHHSLREIRARIDSLVPGMDKSETIRRCFTLLNLVRRDMQEEENPRSRRMLKHWEEELERLVIVTKDLRLQLVPDDSIVVSGQNVRLNASLQSGEGNPTIAGITVFPAPGWTLTEAPRSSSQTWQARIVPGPASVHTLPRITAQYRPIEQECTTVVRFDLVVDGKEVSIHRDITIDVAPTIELAVSPKHGWLSSSRSSNGVNFDFSAVNRSSHKTAGTLTVDLPEGWSASPQPFVVEKEDGIATGTVAIIPGKVSGTRAGKVRFAVRDDVDSTSVRLLDVKVAGGTRLGIIKSYDNTLETVARNLDIPFTLLGQKDLESGNLQVYSTIVLDIRTYAVRGDVREHNERLLQYVREGGNLVVFYHKTQEWKSEYAPYPMELTRDRITDEEAPVTVLVPDHPLLHTPNEIGEDDWSGWVQERGVYFPGEISAEYVKILSSHDPDEQPLDTGLLVARFGKGSYIYTSYVWYRQMKEAHPGCIRFFANLISYSGERK